MTREIDYLIATGTEDLTGPQFLATTTILDLATSLSARKQRTAILVVDPALDPALVTREDSDGIAIYRSAQPISTLPALSLALGQPRILVLPNQLAAYDLLQTPGLDVVAWLGEDDLAALNDRGVTVPLTFWADSTYVGEIARRLTQRPVEIVPPPLGPGVGSTMVRPDINCVAMVGARPRDGIALILNLARRRRDLRFIIVEWPHLSSRQRQQLFVLAAGCGNIDWRRPDGPASLIAALSEAGVILVPAMQPIGHRDWICQMQQLGRPFLASDLGALPDLISTQEQLLSAGAGADDWLQRLDLLRRGLSTPAGAHIASSPRQIIDKLLARAG